MEEELKTSSANLNGYMKMLWFCGQTRANKIPGNKQNQKNGIDEMQIFNQRLNKLMTFIDV